MSIPDMLEKFVGSSNENLRAALNIIRATSQGRAFFLATCNAMINISGPLRRRFAFGQWMFDLPSKDEREMIWPIHMKKYGLPKQDLPADEGWTGAEIRNCCKMAYQMKTSLKQAAEFIVPVSRTMAEEIDKMRQSANGRFKSASYPGFYQLNRPAAAITPAGGKRAIAMEG
jgi:SpoVK/Ycf46/Vps4 family AAA+-type ATPase